MLQRFFLCTYVSGSGKAPTTSSHRLVKVMCLSATSSSDRRRRKPNPKIPFVVFPAKRSDLLSPGLIMPVEVSWYTIATTLTFRVCGDRFSIFSLSGYSPIQRTLHHGTEYFRIISSSRSPNTPFLMSRTDRPLVKTRKDGFVRRIRNPTDQRIVTVRRR